MIKKILLVATLGGFLVAGVAQAQANDLPAPGMLPGNPLYFLKSLGEAIGTFLTFGDVPKAERALVLAERRLTEVSALVDKGKPELAQRLLIRYQEHLASSLSRVEAAKTKRVSVEEVSKNVAEAAAKHQIVLDEVLEKVPETAKEAILRAKEVSLTGQLNALRALAAENPERATEINLKAAEGKLNRANTKAEKGEIEEAERAIKEFENLTDFSRQISDVAQQVGKDITKLEELVARATSVHLEVLAGVYNKVPEEAKPAIERAMEESVKGHQRAVEALRAKGVLEEISLVPEIVPMPEIIPPEARERVMEKGREEVEKEIQKRLEVEIEKRVRCQIDADCRELICPMVVGADTPRCDEAANACYCGPGPDVLIPELPIEVPKPERP